MSDPRALPRLGERGCVGGPHRTGAERACIYCAHHVLSEELIDTNAECVRLRAALEQIAYPASFVASRSVLSEIARKACNDHTTKKGGI